ncbi:F-box/kelch-repeat protein At3g23880-like [Lotus japonicus]|uniref:F-box/kelch-repeat protein At3g23880-like n=1 Tax=Lotus japonicus TaxID=34305 RepID=UPI00258F7205|nr:F-box/kelch-repeat protein At3g23880-like [Lotus japonicus]XP_057432864.1 F-box/kelch-repeat protein At3g23880-like [Lotus japonicus]
MAIVDLVPVLPFELLIEILSWLPVETLMQLRRVSKSWKSLISEDRDFMTLHLKRSPKNKHQHILLTLLESSFPYLEYDEPYAISCPVRHLLKESSPAIDEDGRYTLKENYLVAGSCNGLVCLQGFCDLDIMGEFWVRLWNPTTRLRSNKSPTFCNDADSVNFGFGYDDSRDTYKVVVLSNYYYNRREPKLETMVHCIGTDSCWRKILNDPGFPFSLKELNGHFVGGCINWLALNELKCHQKFVIVSFDMCKEAYSSLSLPDGTNESTSQLPNLRACLGVLDNCLCLFNDQKGTHFVVWKMREYGVQESWTRLVSVNYEHLRCVGFRCRPLMCLSEDGDILLLIQKENLDVIMYTVRDNSVKYVQLPDNKIWSDVIGYVQSLVSPC